MAEKTDLTDGLEAQWNIEHEITFGKFRSFRLGLHLHERLAVTPVEKEVKVDIPYRQGAIDMSRLTGGRIFYNRTITYVFYRFNVEQKNAKVLANHFQTTIENLLMREFDQELHDSYDPEFHYKGKCSEVVVLDEYSHKRLRVEITFDLYPFKISNRAESTDLFDPLNFELDVFQDELRFAVGTSWQTIQVYNAGHKIVAPSIIAQNSAGATIATTGLEISMNGRIYRPTGEPNFARIRLTPGVNVLQLRRTTGSVQWMRLDWQKEWI